MLPIAMHLLQRDGQFLNGHDLFLRHVAREKRTELLCRWLTEDSWCALAQLGFRFSHVLRRMLPIAMHLLQRDGQFLHGHDLFLRRIGAGETH